MSHDGSVIGYDVAVAGQRPAIYVTPIKGGAAEKICDDCGRFWHWSTDRRRIIAAIASDRAYLETIDLASGLKTDFLRHQELHLHSPQFSPDDRWIQFTARAWLDRKQIFIVPFPASDALEKSDWIAVTEGTAWEDAVVWGLDGNRLYFLSERDGFRCIWAQDLNAATKKPVGKAFAVYHAHRAKLSLLNLTWGFGALEVSRDRVAFGQGELSGNIWMAKRPASR